MIMQRFMSGATIVEVPKSDHEQRLERFIKMRKKISNHNKGVVQKLVSDMQKNRSKNAGLSANLLCDLLREFGAEVTIEHTKAPKLDVLPGTSGFGEREIMEDIWFGEEDENPHFGNVPEDSREVYIYAQRASGYTVAKVSFTGQGNTPTPKGIPLHVFGKSICSANETFNGNIGAFFALMDVLNLLSRTEDFYSPLKQLFSFAISLLNVDLDIPSHYEDHLSLIGSEE